MSRLCFRHKGHSGCTKGKEEEGKSTKKIKNHVLIEESSRVSICGGESSTCILGTTGRSVLVPVGIG